MTKSFFQKILLAFLFIGCIGNNNYVSSDVLANPKTIVLQNSYSTTVVDSNGFIQLLAPGIKGIIQQLKDHINKELYEHACTNYYSEQFYKTFGNINKDKDITTIVHEFIDNYEKKYYGGDENERNKAVELLSQNIQITCFNPYNYISEMEIFFCDKHTKDIKTNDTNEEIKTKITSILTEKEELESKR
jgi:hypothetical protein